MKRLIITTFLLFHFLLNAQDTLFKADQIGRPEYAQLITPGRIYPVIKGIGESYFELLPSDYFHMNYRYDTLKIVLRPKPEGLQLDCVNCMYMPLGLKDSSVFYIESGDSHLEYDWQLMKKPSGGNGPALKEGQKRDEQFGYVKLVNRTIHYSRIQKEPELYLAFIDRNFNGKVDSLDHVSLAETPYFPTKLNARVNLVKNTDTIVTDNWAASFHLVNSEGEFVLRKTEDPVETPSILFSKKISNFQLDSTTDLTSLLKQSRKKFTIVTFWNEFCPDCMKELDSLEMLQDQFQVLTFYDRDNLSEHVSKRKWTFYSYLSSRIAEESFLLNGMPYYWVLDNERTCLFRSRNWIELRKYLTELNQLKE